MFCTCDTCARARRSGGKNIRTRSQALLDDTILIDFPADTYFHVITHGINLEKIKHCIITHPHSDHFYPSDLEMRGIGFAVTNNNPLNFYGTQIVFETVNQFISEYNLKNDNRIMSHLVIPYKPFFIEDYQIIALPADHTEDIFPVVYIIIKNNTCMLYAHDTGIFEDTVWNWLKSSRIRFDFVSLDCTAGLLTGWEHGHLGLDTCAVFAERLEKSGAADSNTKYCINHFSHNCLADYDEILPKASKLGFDVSYDGKIIYF